jgi:2-polyprenyl-6-methoxyphenol hydroxylase-like FAD-dependent oxidoreductase
MAKIGQHAVVLGGSMAGLLAARVLADFYRTVTVVDRDELGDDPAPRRGVPQGRHIHALLPRGAQAMGELFPGLLEELVAVGVPVWDDGDLSKIDFSVGGHRFVRSGRARDSKTIVFYFPSRPLLECHVRRRLRTDANVTMLPGHDVTELTSTAQRDCVTGVRLVSRDGEDTSVTADLVIDATGRGSRMPVFLDNLGYGRPVEDEVVVRLVYVSQVLRIPPGVLREHIVVAFPEPGRHTLMALCRYENGISMLTVGGMLGEEPPADSVGMASFAEKFAPAYAVTALRAAEPVGDISRYRVPSNRWRRYDKMTRFPKGLLVCGDAICSFNPIYGQGMTVAALDALALRDCLQRGEHDLSRRFFRSSAKVVGVAWQMAAGSDLAFPEVEGPRSRSMRLTNLYTERVLAAAESDPFVANRFLRTMSFVDAPTALLHPSVLRRVATANHRQRHLKTAPTSEPARGAH